MNSSRPFFYRRVRLFCELHLGTVSAATGIAVARLVAIETGRRSPNPTERRLLERFLRDRLRVTFELEGPVPPWLRTRDVEIRLGAFSEAKRDGT